VVATPLPEVVKLNGLLQTALSAEEFLDKIQSLLREGKQGPSVAGSRLMEPESWTRKVEELSWFIENGSSRRHRQAV